VKCERCRGELPHGAPSCPACGAPRPGDTPAGPTETSPPDGTAWTRTALREDGDGSAHSRLAAEPGPPIEPGTEFANRYRILEYAGRGAMGEVYRAQDTKLGQVVALKFLRAQVGAEPRYLERLLNEVRTARQVAHPNVCRVYDVGEAEGRHFLSMEWIDGQTLASVLARRGRLPGDEALRIARQLCAALAAAHERGVIHRDLTPSNVMLDDRGVVRITDFGVAESAVVVRGRRAREGTPAYMAPEQYAGDEVTARSDIYALGLVLYELFTGRQAHRGVTTARTVDAPPREAPPPPAQLAPDLDPAIEQAIVACLAPDPARRPASARQVAAALPGDDAFSEALADAQQRADRIAAFRAELAELREAGVLTIDPAQRKAVEAFQEGVLDDLVRRFDIDVSRRGKQLSLGMRIASLIGAVAFSFATWFFFRRFWGYLALPAQVALLVLAPIAAVLGTVAVARRERTPYVTGIVASLAFALFATDLAVLGVTFSLPNAAGAWLALGLFALALGYAHELRLMLLAGIACGGVGIAGLVAERAGVWWARFGDRPETILPVAVLCALVPQVAPRRQPASFAPIYRLAALAWLAFAVLPLASVGGLSFLPLGAGTVESLYRAAGLVVAGGAIWLGMRSRLAETTYAASLLFVILLLESFFDWWWDVLPKYVFFLLVGAVAIGFLFALRVLRARLRRVGP